ncbi:MAG: hypothetical protein HDS84_06030 [Bacteroidales bacterium]|nr:hypothetical protein [Bacteroidales bacterium]
MRNLTFKQAILSTGIAVFTLLSAVVPAKAEKRIYINPTGDEFPILAYHAFKPNLVNDQNYRILHDCGFNMAHGWCEDTTFISKSLDIAARYGIKLLVNCPQTRNEKLLPGIAKRYNVYTATAGYLLWDEPVVKQFEHMRQLIDAVLSVDDRKLAYVNLLPNYARKDVYGSKDYPDYLETFVRIANPQFLSYDNYGILEEKGKLTLRPDYFENLEIARDVCLQHDLPLWTFCRSTAHHAYAVPDEGQLMFEAFSGLSYGSKAIQYYGYASDVIDNEVITQAPVDQQGKRRKVWYAMQKTNREIKTVGRILLPCKTIDVWHTGIEIPKGTRQLKQSDLPGPFRRIVSEPAGIIVSHHREGNRNYLLVVNKDFENSQKVTIQKDSEVKRIYSNGTAKIDNSSTVKLKPGSWCLYTW